MNEKCNKCGNENFAVARNMIGTRICMCGNTWLPGEIKSEVNAYDLIIEALETARDTIERLDKENKELKARIWKLREALYAAENLISYETPLAMSPKAAAMNRYGRALEALKEDVND